MTFTVKKKKKFLLQRAVLMFRYQAFPSRHPFVIRCISLRGPVLVVFLSEWLNMYFSVVVVELLLSLSHTQI